MRELIEYIAKSIVDRPDEVVVTEEEAEDGVILRLQVAPEDTGKVIGKEGRIAKAMRTLLRVAAIRKNTRATLEIISDSEPPRGGYGSRTDLGPRSEPAWGGRSEPDTSYESSSEPRPSDEPDSDSGYGASSEPDSGDEPDSDSGYGASSEPGSSGSDSDERY
jgi:predicted RNA-binding protein YlqC (UPF0109 family)